MILVILEDACCCEVPFNVECALLFLLAVLSADLDLSTVPIPAPALDTICLDGLLRISLHFGICLSAAFSLKDLPPDIKI